MMCVTHSINVICLHGAVAERSISSVPSLVEWWGQVVLDRLMTQSQDGLAYKLNVVSAVRVSEILPMGTRGSPCRERDRMSSLQRRLQPSVRNSEQKSVYLVQNKRCQLELEVSVSGMEWP